MPDTYTHLPASGVQTIVLAFDMANYNPATVGQDVNKVLNDAAVQKAITTVLQNQAQAQLAALKASSPGTAPKPAAGAGAAAAPTVPGALALPLGATSASSVQDAIKQLQLNPDYSLLVQDLKKLESSFEKSVIGVFVNDHEKQLIIIASSIAVAAVAAMFAAKTGDTPADWATQLAKDKFMTFKVGKIEFGIGAPQFKPSTSLVGATASVGVKDLKILKEAQINLTGAYSAMGAQSLGVAAKATVAITHDISVTTQANLDVITQIRGVNLGVKYDRDGFNVSLEAGLTQTKGVVTEKADLSAKWKFGNAEIGPKIDYSKGPTGAGETTVTGVFTYRFK